jgi:hypothetical protein
MSRKIILKTNRSNDGDIFVFDRKGKGIRKINRKGQGGEEYIMASDIVLDENNNEMFVRDNPARKILVYDTYGNYLSNFNDVRATFIARLSLQIFKQSENDKIETSPYPLQRGTAHSYPPVEGAGGGENVLVIGKNCLS